MKQQNKGQNEGSRRQYLRSHGLKAFIPEKKLPKTVNNVKKGLTTDSMNKPTKNEM